METNKKNQNQGIDLAKTSGSSPPVTVQYLNYLHPIFEGLVTPRGAKVLVESSLNAHGEPDGINFEMDLVEKWPGAIGTEFKNAKPIDGTKNWLCENFGKDLMFKRSTSDHKQVAYIEQVSVNQFTIIENGSNGNSTDTLGLKNLLIDFDSVPQNQYQEFSKWLTGTGLPFSFSVATGSKGVHVILCLDKKIQANKYADRIAYAISETLEKLGAERWGLDKGPLDGDRKYTSACRLPGLLRFKTQTMQELLESWKGYIELEQLEEWLTKNLKSWKSKNYEKVKGKVKSDSFANSKMSKKALALKEMVEFAKSNDWIYANKFFWVWDGSSYYKKIDWNNDQPKEYLWPIYKRIVGYEGSDGQFKDRIELLKNEVRSELGEHRDLINFNNGVLDLKSLQLSPPRKDYRFNYCIPFEYDFDITAQPDAAPNWERILSNHIPSEDDRRLLEQFLGYLLTDDRNKKQMLILFGKRDTGKSTILNFLKRLLGSELVALERVDKILDEPAHAVNIVDKRVSISSELKFKLKDTESFKALIDFEELSIHIYHQGKATVSHSCRFITSTNHHAWIPDSEEIRKRLRVVEFDNPVTPENQDPKLLEKLWEERRSIVHRWLAAYLKVREFANFGIYESTKNYMKASAENINHVAPWVHDLGMETGPNWYPTKFLYEKYKTDSGDDRTTEIDFARKLKEAGIVESKEPREYEFDGLPKRSRGRYINLNLDESFRAWRNPYNP